VTSLGGQVAGGNCNGHPSAASSMYNCAYTFLDTDHASCSGFSLTPNSGIPRVWNHCTASSIVVRPVVGSSSDVGTDVRVLVVDATTIKVYGDNHRSTSLPLLCTCSFSALISSGPNIVSLRDLAVSYVQLANEFSCLGCCLFYISSKQ
jgi:hypothetical protein